MLTGEEQHDGRIKMHNWPKVVLSTAFMGVGGFVITYTYCIWLAQHGLDFLGSELDSLKQLLYIYYVFGSISLVQGLVFAYKKVNRELSRLARATFLGSLTVFSSYLVYEAYQTSIWPSYYRWQPFYYVAGLVSFVTGLIIIYNALKTEILKSTRRIISAIFIITGSFLIYDSYLISARSHQALDFLLRHSLPSTVAESFEALLTAYQWLPLYTAFALTCIALGLIIAYKTLSAVTINSATGIYLGGLMVFSSYLVYEAYRSMIWPWYQWLPLYYVVGLISFAIGLIITHKALNTQKFRFVKKIVSVTLAVIGLFLIYDAYNINVEYYQIFSNHVPTSLLTPYQWLPLYFVFALASIASGLVIAYKTFKTPKLTNTRT